MKILLEPKDTLIFNRKLTCSPDGTMSKQATLARVEEYEGQKVLVTLPMSKLEVPDNVNSFEKMELHYLDANVLEILQKLRHLFTDVHLFLKSSNEKKARQVLQHLMPLVSSIDSIYLCQQETYNFLLDRFPSTMYNTKVLQHLCGQFQQRINIDAYYNWLIHKRDDGNPKMLLLANIGVEQLGAFLQTIHERFLAAQDNEGPVSFFVRIEHFHRRPNDIVEQTVVNSATGEQLVVKIILHPNHPESLLITRWPINVSEAEEQELAINWHCFFSGKHIIVDPVECDLKEGDQEQQEATASGCSDHSSLASADGSTATNDLKTKKGHV